MPNEKKALLTPFDLAEELSSNEQTIRRYMREGELPSVRIGRRLYCPREHFNKMIEDKLQGKEG